MTSPDARGGDGFLGSRLTLRQPARGHRVGSDAVLLAAAAPRGAQRIADLGCGVGAVGLALLLREETSHVLLVDADAEIAALAAENAEANGLSTRCRVIVADIAAAGKVRRAAGLQEGSVDLVVANPPFAEAARSTPSPDAGRASAHVMPSVGLDRWLRAAADLLKPGGDLVLIHRPEALPRLLSSLAGRFGAVVVKPVLPREGAHASRLLLRARKGSRALFAIAPPFVLHTATGAFTPLAEALHRGAADLAW